MVSFFFIFFRQLSVVGVLVINSSFSDDFIHERNFQIDLMTGIVPSNRNQGLSKEMFNLVKRLLIQQGIRRYLLEVLQENKTAFEIYKKQGFEVTRSFSVFKLDNSNEITGNNSHTINFESELSEEQWSQVQLFWDSEPSWQNAIESIQNVKKSFDYALVVDEGVIIGYGIVDSKTGDVPQIAIHKDYRKRGIGKQLVLALLNKTKGESLNVVNVDDDRSMIIA